ncbi:GATA zinc finger domain-containing protein 16-like isoform X3 [Homarus americanus]|uniref:GATA zinc finger domain-containing protein 16-like isoform X3 n=1 Tax=Homarus americanus TaxID=6706 RepID=UPI001C4683FB|nr:GATA zinc finger domain-containing protein 16-like isoform X3 [Homarus americanus]XP_042224501.1 GATA zinc finger domain-containing protein 16-like isoform X3 [Homarus americanus]XP_042224502.1 GATA zinc finger domain-containing protein 16-like isoform X3 [Homarus americanus]
MEGGVLCVLLLVTSTLCAGQLVRPRSNAVTSRWLSPSRVLAGRHPSIPHGQMREWGGASYPTSKTAPQHNTLTEGNMLELPIPLRPRPLLSRHRHVHRRPPGVLLSRLQPRRNSMDVPVVAPLPPREVMEALPGAISRVMTAYNPSIKDPTTTTTQPPVIWFPNQQEDCQQENSGGGFSTFSLLALLMSATNLVGILASNANNNLNNNNNNDNNNNNNIQDGNENNANNNANIFTRITTGTGKKRRRRRKREEKREEKDDVCWVREEETLTAEEVSSVVSLGFLRSYLQASLTTQPSCLTRSLCRANAAAAEWGDLALILAQALSVAHVEWVSQNVVGVSKKALQEAAAEGRSGASCDRRYRCPAAVWAKLRDNQAVMDTFLRLSGQVDAP